MKYSWKRFQLFQYGLWQWKIQKDKIVIIVTNKAANLVKAVGNLFEEEKHFPRLADSANLFVKKVFHSKKGDSVAKKIKEVVIWFKEC